MTTLTRPGTHAASTGRHDLGSVAKPGNESLKLSASERDLARLKKAGEDPVALLLDSWVAATDELGLSSGGVRKKCAGGWRREEGHNDNEEIKHRVRRWRDGGGAWHGLGRRRL